MMAYVSGKLTVSNYLVIISEVTVYLVTHYNVSCV
jgi:hypothetical protein